MRQREPTGILDRETILTELTQALRQAHESPKQLAARVGISVTTVYNVRNEQVSWPRPKTLFGLLDATGLALKVVKKKT